MKTGLKHNPGRFILGSVMVLLLMLPAVARAQDYTYTTNDDGTITITRYTGPGGVVTIPDSINGLTVTSIGDDAFYECYNLTAVTIPNTVINIGAEAFYFCWALTSITIPDSVTSIGDYAFFLCQGLSSFTISRNVTNIGVAPFAQCTSLTSISVDTLNPAYSSEDGVLFNKNQTILIQYPGAKPGTYTIPDSVTDIGLDAFYCCDPLTGIIIPNSVTNIGSGAFTGCRFMNCVTIGTGVATIPDNAFYDCERLTNVTIPDNVTEIGNEAFYQCFGMTNITLGTGVVTIGDGAFMYCGNLSSVRFPQSVTNIGVSALFGCYALTSINIPNQLTTIPWRLCYFCISLQQVTIGSNVTYIDQEAFRGCTSLRTISLPESVTTLANFAFSDCASLTNVAMPGVTWIGNSAFARCSSLSTFTVPESAITIDAFAFYQCSNLTNVRIGSSVSNIDYWAFKDCTSLTGVYFLGNAPSLGPSVFEDDLLATIYYLPATAGWGPTFGGRPTAVWNVPPPIIQRSPVSQTAEVGTLVLFSVGATNSLPLWYVWYFNETNLVGCSKKPDLRLTNVQFSQSGEYTVAVTNGTGTVTGAPVRLQVIAPVTRRPVPALNLFGDAGALLSIDCASSLAPAPNWLLLETVTLTGTSQFYFDITAPLPPQRFYRAWQTGTPSVVPSLAPPLIVPAITLTGAVGNSVRVEYINQFGPTDAWVTLDTVTLTNMSQLCFDTSSIGQPARLYRLVQLP